MIFFNQKIDYCFKSFHRLTTKKTSKHKISGLLWAESTADWIAVLPKHHNQLHLTHFWILIYSQLLTTIQIWRCCVNISHHSDVTWGTWRLQSPETQLLFLDSTKVTSKLSIIGSLWGESSGILLLLSLSLFSSVSQVLFLSSLSLLLSLSFIAQIGPLSFQAAIEHTPRQVRWGGLHAPVVTEWWPACLHKQFPSVHRRGN